MSDMTDLRAAYGDHQTAVAEANVINKGAVFDALANAGIATVNVVFDGEGDSGQIESIMADDSAELPDIAIGLQQANWGTGKLDSKQTTLRDAIVTLCYDFLEQEHGGWENNDGAHGEFNFLVAERTVDLDFNARYSGFVNFNHSF